MIQNADARDDLRGTQKRFSSEPVPDDSTPATLRSA